MKSALVTGAHGFLGRHIVKACAKNGIEVFGLGHGNWLRDEWSHLGLSTWLQGDVNLENLLKLRVLPNFIFHCAGGSSVGYSIEFPEQDFNNTVKTTEEVLKFVKSTSPQTAVVLPSSGAVYGVMSQGPIQEGASLRPMSPYGAHKKMAEDSVSNHPKPCLSSLPGSNTRNVAFNCI